MNIITNSLKSQSEVQTTSALHMEPKKWIMSLMSTITFDTLKFATRLIDAGVGEAKAEAEALRDVFAEAIDSTVATRADINRIEGKFNLLQWMIGFNLAFSMALLWKIYG